MKRAVGVVLILILGAGLVLRLVLFDWLTVQGDDMLPTLTSGQSYLVYKHGHPERGDLILFVTPGNGPITVRRVLGLPGDKIELKNQTVFVNGQGVRDEKQGELQMDKDGPLERKLDRYRESLPPAGDRSFAIARDPQRHSKDQAVTVVPPGTFYVYADNRNHGRDSREYGPVPLANVRGIVVRHARSLISYDPLDQSDSLK
jgi:signal peptidase I